MSTPPAAIGPTPPSTPPPGHLDRELIHGLAWTGAARWTAQIVTWVATLLLARLLTPQDFGIWAAAAVYQGIITLLSEFGVGASVVMLRDLDDDQIAQIYGFSLLLGLVSVIVSFAAATPLGWFYDSAPLPRIIIALSSLFLITSLRTVPVALLQRERRFKSLALVDTAKALVQSAALLTFAFLGFRFWTFVLGAVAAELVHTLLILRLRRHAIAWPRLGSIRAAMSFSIDVVIARLSWYLYSNADVMIGLRVLGESLLGAYNMAWTLASVPVEKVSSLVVNVTPAFFSALQKDAAEMRRYVTNLSGGIAMITYPAAIGIALVAPDFVPVALGPGWDAAILPLQILALYTTVRAITPILTPVLNAVGETRFAMRNNLLALAIMPVAFIAGSRYGPGGLAGAWLIAHPIIVVLLCRRAFRRIDLRAFTYLRSLAPAIGGCIAMAGAVLLVRLAGADLAQPFRLALDVAAGALTYTGYLFAFHRDRIASLRRLAALARRRPD